jgi:transcriptional regulator with XRE-family HTH domain
VRRHDDHRGGNLISADQVSAQSRPPVKRDNDLGRAIAMLRGARTQAAVSEAADLDPGTWSEYETGRRRPREGNLARIVAALGCTRLELEEAVWQLRRQRLGRAQAGAQDANAAGLLAEVVRFTEATGSGRERDTGDPGRGAEDRRSPSSPSRGPEPDTADPVRQELRAILGRFSAVLEDLLIFLLRARRGGVSAERGEHVAIHTTGEEAEPPRVARAG